ncbi:MAG: hypothetical protein BWY57_00731 [Betaproteobacteria bacterium ADurb.Bin341]|nr:MAG: hypothetical protein BWY57_00731 [Betaproteobacteria bacterium ADurb.Bin341]
MDSKYYLLRLVVTGSSGFELTNASPDGWNKAAFGGRLS